MDIVIITTVTWSVQRLFPHIREDNVSRQNCVVNDALVHSMLNVQQTLFMIFNCLKFERPSLIDETINLVNSKFAQGFIFRNIPKGSAATYLWCNGK